MGTRDAESFYKGVLSEAKDQVLKEVTKAIGEIKYGEVVITIHDSKVVQIERTEKMRLQHNKDPIG